MIFNTTCSRAEIIDQLDRLLANPNIDPNDTAKIKRLREKIEAVRSDIELPPDHDAN